MDPLEKPSIFKYIGVYLLAVFSANILATIIVSIASDQFILSSLGFFIIASAEVIILYYVIIFVYSKFLDLDMNKVILWIMGLMILKYVVLISDLSQYKNLFPNYTFLLACIILQPVSLYILLKNHFVKNGRIN